jgi:rhodanese-related sulfurtransferase
MKLKLLWLGILSFLIPINQAFSFDTITPKDAYNLVTDYDNVYILDVRTNAEWTWVGHPGVNGVYDGTPLEGKVVNIAIRIDCGEVIGDKPDPNPNFVSDVKANFDPKHDVLITMCREGIRGAAAAKILESENYKVMNMEGGFEGEPNKRGYRYVNGWVNKGLPYTYKGLGYQGKCPEK